MRDAAYVEHFARRVGESAWDILTRRCPALRKNVALGANVIVGTEQLARTLATMPCPPMPEPLERLIEKRDWPAARELVIKVKWREPYPGYLPWHRLHVCVEMILSNPNVEDWPRLLSIYLEYADGPSHEPRIRPILVLLHSLSLRVFDNDAAERAFDALPDSFQVFRGTLQAEADSRKHGLCWTLNRDVALLFARFQPYSSNWSSPAVLLSARAKRTDVLAIFLRRGHEEVMLLPEKLQPIRVEALPQDNVKSRFDELTDADREAWRSRIAPSGVLT